MAVHILLSTRSKAVKCVGWNAIDFSRILMRRNSRNVASESVQKTTDKNQEKPAFFQEEGEIISYKFAISSFYALMITRRYCFFF